MVVKYRLELETDEQLVYIFMALKLLLLQNLQTVDQFDPAEMTVLQMIEYLSPLYCEAKEEIKHRKEEHNDV